jgi:small membrane protein
MIIQIILTLGFGLIALYGWAHVRRMRLVSAGMMLLSAVAIYFIWNPGVTTLLARILGIGRGADLMMYFFFVFVIFQLIVLHVKQRSQMMALTQLARRIAIDEARVPEKRDG